MTSVTVDQPYPPIFIMAEKKLSDPSSPSHPSVTVRDPEPECGPTPHQNGGLESGSSPPSLCNSSPPSSKTLASISPLRTLRSIMSRDGISNCTRPWSRSLGSALSPRTTATVNRCMSSQQEEPDALLDLILELQGQRLNDQRASLSLLPEPGPAAHCGTCSHSQAPLPSLDFYYMLIHYQSDRMEEQRCPLPDLEDVIGSGPEGQEDFFSLIQRVQSRRMDEQRASMLITEDEDEAYAAVTSHLDQTRTV